MRGVSWTLGAAAIAAAVAGGWYYEAEPQAAGVVLPLAALALGGLTLAAAPRGHARRAA